MCDKISCLRSYFNNFSALLQAELKVMTEAATKKLTELRLVQNERVPKGDELPIMVPLTGDSGSARIWGHVKHSL